MLTQKSNFPPTYRCIIVRQPITARSCFDDSKENSGQPVACTTCIVQCLNLSCLLPPGRVVNKLTDRRPIINNLFTATPCISSTLNIKVKVRYLICLFFHALRTQSVMWSLVVCRAQCRSLIPPGSLNKDQHNPTRAQREWPNKK